MVANTYCSCGYVIPESSGVFDLRTAEDRQRFERFTQEYRRVRASEGWGDDDPRYYTNLPHSTSRHNYVWSVRRRTFQALERLIQERFHDRRAALDVGAGNCWLTRNLSDWQFQAVALDISDDPRDGLAARKAYRQHFWCVLSPMERLPFPDQQFQFVVASGSFHYASAPDEVLAEFTRVLEPNGLIVIMDTPTYFRIVDGEQMVEDRTRTLTTCHGMTREIASWSKFITFKDLGDLFMNRGLEYEVIQPWPGIRRSASSLWNRIRGTRIARFPLFVAWQRT